MKNRFISGFLCGALIFGAAGAFAATYMASDNPFPIQLNGQNVNIEGYNIEGRTYFKLRDIADVIGGFTVDFQNDTIQLGTNGYVYQQSLATKVYPDRDWVYEHSPEGFSYKLPQFNISTSGAYDINKRVNDAYAAVISADSDVGVIGYNTHQNGNILSLVTKGILKDDTILYTANSIDLTDGSKVTNDRLAEMSGTDMDGVLNVVGDMIEEKLGEWQDKISDAEYNQLVARAYSKECYSAEMPMYLNSEGHLIAIPSFATPSGSAPEEVDTGFKIN